MAVIESGYLKVLQANPDETVAVIIRTAQDEAVDQAKISALGMEVTRKFSLISAVAATGPASAVIALANESWVAGIEPDKPVQAFNNE